MALIDVYQLCLDNKDVLEHTDKTYKFTAYQLIDGTTSSYIVKNITDVGQYFVAPQRAVGLIANDTYKASRTLPIVLKPSALVALTGNGIVVSHSEVATPETPAPRRRIAEAQLPTYDSKRLYIVASNETDEGVKKAYLTIGEQADASRGFVKGEDALCLSSGLNYFSYSSFSTPLTMYTIADNEALMMDLRDTLGTVPLVFGTLDDRFEINNRTVLSFATEGEWDTPLYLYDALTNDSVLILNGLQVAIETPLDNQIRYFINGRPVAKATEEQEVTTGVENPTPDSPSPVTGESSTVIYDILGRRIMTLGEYDLISTIQLPTGVYVIQRGDNTERMVIR